MRASLWRAIGTTVAEPEKEKAALVKSKTDIDAVHNVLSQRGKTFFRQTHLPPHFASVATEGLRMWF